MINELSIYEEEKNTSALIAAKVMKALLNKNATVAVAESCTGGLIGSELSSLSGSSQVFNGGFICYTNQLKHELLGVKESTLESFGAVSEETVFEMATNAREITHSDYAIAVSGIAGPNGGSIDKPVGTVCIAIATAEKTYTFLKKFIGNRHEVRLNTVYYTLQLLLEKIKM